MRFWAKFRRNVRDLITLTKSVELQLLITSMTFNTMLSIVPIVALVLAVVKAHLSGHPESVEMVKDFIYRNLAIGSPEQISATLDMFLARIEGGVLGAIGFLSLSFTSVMLVQDISKAVHRIWQLPSTKKIYWRYLQYLLVVLLGPLMLLAAALLLHSEYLDFLTKIPFFSVGSVISIVLLFAVYKWAPQQHVCTKSALIGALTTAALIYLLREAYKWIAINILQYNKIYGSLAAIPMFLVWLWVLWGVFLFGVALTATLHKQRTLEDENKAGSTAKSLSALLVLALLFGIGNKLHAAEYEYFRSKTVREICPGKIFIQKRKKIEFSQNERKLLCGDPSYAAWKEVPFNQAEFHLRSFLQDRGYFNPQFDHRGDTLWLDPGRLTRIRQLNIEGISRKDLNPRKKRHVRRFSMTPKKLDEIEAWAKTEIQNDGYPCPTVKLYAFSDTGKVKLDIQLNKAEVYEAIVEQNIDGLDPKVMRRFNAFVIGQPFSQMRNTLTANRVEADGIMQNAALLAVCGGDREPFVIKQVFIPGKARLFTVGFGANTETYLLVKSSLKFQRLDDLGSSISTTLLASFLKQEIATTAEWYVLHPPSRWHLKPTITITHEDEEQFEVITGEVSVGPSAKLDSQRASYNLFFGPGWSWTRTLEGVAADEDAFFFSALMNLEAMTHDFEFFRTSPRSGGRIKLGMALNHAKIYSDVTAQRLNIEGVQLWNLGRFSPPMLVLGVRGRFATTVTDRSEANFGLLPPNYFHFLGGSTDLRGFDRQELPKNNLLPQEGALTTAFGSLELRLVDTLPWGVQPMLFADMGATGQESLKLENPIYWNPGTGVRLQTPIGVFRSTVAYGFLIDNTDPTLNDLSHFQFFISYGEEF